MIHMVHNLLRHGSIQLIQRLNHVAPVQDGAALLIHLVEHEVAEQLQQVPVACARQVPMPSVVKLEDVRCGL